MQFERNLTQGDVRGIIFPDVFLHIVGGPFRMTAVFAFALPDQQDQQLMEIQSEHGLAVQFIAFEFPVEGPDQGTDIPSRAHDLPRRGGFRIELGREYLLHPERIVQLFQFGRDHRIVEEDIVKHDLPSGNIPGGQFFRMDDDQRIFAERDFPVAGHEIAAALGDEGDFPELPLEPSAQIEIFRPVLRVADRERKVIAEKRLALIISRLDPVLHRIRILLIVRSIWNVIYRIRLIFQAGCANWYGEYGEYGEYGMVRRARKTDNDPRSGKIDDSLIPLLPFLSHSLFSSSKA